jgi:exosome complex RNA-binding protein Csl4
MRLAHIACALGRHRIDQSKVKKIFGMNVARCSRCATPLEESWRDHWVPQRIGDAGLDGWFR